ncbi:ABC transporter ATP-binding protein [Natronosporangium hydrolyticum]|uniref:ABC transporter ATP-binding protein n=1 Tax=Natronosporangium hydrolyticum TaxID=2811111 RepID=A0A895YLG6_9ACTN|nr:ABC transporter ATP-binding protein [Natronosporangium hydrolyticum]QSB16822.1 ABC transporter ATP-binding protein [Natronosporangium hydrolyticum]
MMVHRRLLRLAGDIRGALAVNVILGLLVLASYAVQAVLVAWIFLLLLEGNELAAILPPLTGLLAMIALRSGLHYVSEIAAQRTAHAVKERIRGRLYAKLLQLGPGYLTRSRSGDVRTTLVDGVEALEAYYSRYLPTVAVALLGPAGILAYLATRDPLSAAVIAVSIVLVLVVPRLWDRMLARSGEVHWQRYGQLSSDYLDAMQGMTTLKAFNAVARERQTLADRARRLYHATMRYLGVSLFDSSITAFGLLAGPAIAIGLGAIRVANGALDLFTLLVLLVLARECFRPLGDLSKYWHAGYTGITSSKQIEALLQEPLLVEDQPSADGSDLEPSITFDRVDFHYPERPEPVLREVSLEVAPGETVAVVGPSGAGKSTLVSLLLRYFDVSGGRVLVGGVDVRQLPLARLRAMVSVVAQDTYLFTGTIAENIRLGRPETTDEEVRAAAAAANADEFIRELPDGYQTEVGERGMSLSGGQRQRIALARAVLKDAPILVLDEATSSVDSASEAAIQEALGRVTATRTTLVIAHRLSTVREADRIVLIKDGAIQEAGRHQDLLDLRGDYARLVSAQEVIG